MKGRSSTRRPVLILPSELEAHGLFLALRSDGETLDIPPHSAADLILALAQRIRRERRIAWIRPPALRRRRRRGPAP